MADRRPDERPRVRLERQRGTALAIALIAILTVIALIILLGDDPVVPAPVEETNLTVRIDPAD